MSWLNLVSLFGLVAFAGLAWLIGGCHRPLPWRTVMGSGGLMLGLGVVIFWFPPTRALLVAVNDVVLAVLARGNAGSEFLFGPLAMGPGASTPSGEPSIGFVLATQVLPAVVFFSALMAACYHLRIIQPVVRLFGRVFHRGLRLSGAESLTGAANIFFGVESATMIRPYLASMTRSELLTVLTCGMSTIASTVLAIYVLFLRDAFPQIAGHLVSASVLSIPAAAMTSKLLLPESDQPETAGSVPALDESQRHGNTFSALTAGAWDGLKLAAGIATLLIAVLGVVAVLDLALSKIGSPVETGIGGPLSFARILGWLFTPLAWLLGIPSADVVQAAQLLGQRLVITEVVSYRQLGELAQSGALTPRTVVVLSYALCGFAHVASLGIFVGGYAALAPERRDDLAGLGLRALAGATLATLMTGALAGLFFHGQRGLLIP